jgi:hypothetical protein
MAGSRLGVEAGGCVFGGGFQKLDLQELRFFV